MHELAVCQSLLREVARVAESHGAASVSDIVVAVGPLSGVEAPLLARAFTIAREGTVAAAATLTTEAVPVTVWCAACGEASDARPNELLCKTCGSWQVKLQSGDELLLKRVALEMPADAAPA